MYNKTMEEKIVTKEYIESKGYDVDEISPRIFAIKNFLKEQEIQSLKDIVASKTEEDWSEHYMNGVRMLAKLKYDRDDIDNLVAEGKVEITQNWADKAIAIHQYPVTQVINHRLTEFFDGFPDLHGNTVGTIQRQYSNVPLGKHVDNHTDPSLVYAAVIYFNDDYTDGELYFTNQNLEIRPEPGTMMLFPTTKEFEHGVNAPGDGPTRYAMPCFIARKDFYGKNNR